MILSSESLEVLSFLKSTPGQFNSLRTICRQAGGRRKYDESPGWARGLMNPLVESGLVEVNERGHYRLKETASAAVATGPATAQAPKEKKRIVGDDYFPEPESAGVIGDDYFPTRRRVGGVR